MNKNKSRILLISIDYFEGRYIQVIDTDRHKNVLKDSELLVELIMRNMYNDVKFKAHQEDITLLKDTLKHALNHITPLDVKALNSFISYPQDYEIQFAYTEKEDVVAELLNSFIEEYVLNSVTEEYVYDGDRELVKDANILLKEIERQLVDIELNNVFCKTMDLSRHFLEYEGILNTETCNDYICCEEEVDYNTDIPNDNIDSTIVGFYEYGKGLAF